MSLDRFERPWTPEEEDRLRASYTVHGIKGATAALPERSEAAIYAHARKLRLSRRRRWTAADDRHLSLLWDEGLRLSAIAKHLGRTRATTYWRAQQLGLPLGCPEGFEYLSKAAERTGYCTKQLWTILRWAKVKVRASLARPTGKVTRRHHIVDPIDVDDAIAAWNSTEPVAAAARRFGVCDDTLRDRLRRIGIRSPGGKKHLRVTETEVARAIALAPLQRARLGFSLGAA